MLKIAWQRPVKRLALRFSPSGLRLWTAVTDAAEIRAGARQSVEFCMNLSPPSRS